MSKGIITEALKSEEIRRKVLERWYDYRTIDWANELEYPEYTTKEVNRFLNL